MAISLSDTNLKEIYDLSTEEKLDLVDLIIKSIRSATTRINLRTDNADISWVDQFKGKWIDSKSADEMVEDLRRSRTSNTDVIL